MMNIVNFILDMILALFPIAAGIIVGVINVSAYNKEYCIWEWLFLVTILAIATIMSYMIIVLK